MDITVFPSKLQGSVSAIPSKSHAHRLMLCAALADGPTRIEIPTICDDLYATMGCITGFGGEIEHVFGQAEVIMPIQDLPAAAVAPCGESGATLRFFLPLAGALGINTTFLLEGKVLATVDMLAEKTVEVNTLLSAKNHLFSFLFEGPMGNILKWVIIIIAAWIALAVLLWLIRMIIRFILWRKKKNASQTTGEKKNVNKV